MKKATLFFAIVAMLAVGCKQTGPDVPEAPSTVKIEPVITRATSTNFENGDQISLSIIKADATTHANNACLTYDEASKSFAGELNWYEDGGQTCSLKAFYPYQAAGFPESFTVASDQSKGAGASDFMVASKNDVYPQHDAVAMVFKHYLSQIIINIVNPAGADIESVQLTDLIPTANIAIAESGEITVTPAEVDADNVIAQPVVANKQYRAIVVPQTSTFGLEVSVASGSVLVKGIPEATLKPGYTYNIDVEISADNVKAKVAGEIENWEDGGNLTSIDVEVPFEEHLDENYFEYDGQKYTVAYMADNKWWMTQNLCYLPKGAAPSANLEAVTAGVFYPIVMNEGKTAVEFSTAEEDIIANGYLYQSEFALGLKVGALTSVAAAQELEGAQGICPKGWHIPTADDILGLVGKAVSPLTTNTAAPYYDSTKGNATIELLNADGFNAAAWGAVTINDNTKTAGTLMGYTAGWPEINSGFLVGSTYAGVTYNTSGDETSGVKNLQFYGFMPMTKNGTFNGSKVSYRIAATVRCVRDAE